MSPSYPPHAAPRTHFHSFLKFIPYNFNHFFLSLPISVLTTPPNPKTTKPTNTITMAQKREKEETELKVPETLSICSSTPPVTVSSPPSQLPAIIDDQRINYVRSDPNPPGVDGSRSSSIFDTTPERTDLMSCAEENRNRSLKRPRDANRCSGPDCRRKLGLMGFRCRCGDMFCSEHRYSDRHGCSYDYKAAGREAIARENPVVKAAKIIKV